ncbi:hypothetical protein Psuf_027200 [Phytohabitans suffuscus]|uniref:Uncharacterized protein n=1 Tax=Phytohabitans suffuscus TaxID=624315 RepID=A0A6F8YH66_9ACTN|nr:hypothetical protein Psuf_027200 [Phytohabitans suffuscus]
MYDSVKADLDGVKDEIKDVAASADLRTPATAPATTTPVARPHRFDLDAT